MTEDPRTAHVCSREDKMTDPIEQIVADALYQAGIRYGRPRTGADFTLPDHGFDIECKQFYSERAIKQLEGREDIILIQGRKAAKGFALMLTAPGGPR